MTYIRHHPPQHTIRAGIKDSIFKKYKERRLEVNRQDSSCVEELIKSQEIINHYDFFWRNNEKINVFKLITKRIPQKSRKDDTKSTK